MIQTQHVNMRVMIVVQTLEYRSYHQSHFHILHQSDNYVEINHFK